MIRCVIRVDSEGCLQGFEAEGHAMGAPVSARSSGAGADLPCAAVTTLLRTASRVLYQHPEIEVRGGAPEPGRMLLDLQRCPARLRPWLEGATDFLLAGLRDIQKEYPRSLKVVIRRKGTTEYGT